MPDPLLSAMSLDGLRNLWPLLLALAAGAAAIFLLLPRPQPYPAWWGAFLGAAALILTGMFVIHTGVFTVETLLFHAFSAIAVIAGALLVTQHNPARAALSFAVVVLSTCGLFLLLAAPFLMAATIIIYAGAIIVTFLFVLMLAQQAGISDADSRSREPLFSALAGFVLLGTLFYVLQTTFSTRKIDDLLAQTRAAAAADNVESMKQLVGEESRLFREYEDFLKSHGLGDLTSEVTTLEQTRWAIPDRERSVEEMRKVLSQLEEIGVKGRHQLGAFQPHGDFAQKKMSAMSGPPSSLPAGDIRRNAAGLPQLPAENATYLGKSLFTDYLLAVELGGLLLLVAIVGAIAITHRGSSQEKPA
jgi:NADH:ubiquinone oxidoreductase subunit 6 (subunit J)